MRINVPGFVFSSPLRLMRITIRYFIALILISSPYPYSALGAEENSRYEIGVPFEVQNIIGQKVSVTLEKNKDQFVFRSRFSHGALREERVYPINGDVSYFNVMGSAICVYGKMFLEEAAETKGAMYVVNRHGEVVMVDKITKADLTW